MYHSQLDAHREILYTRIFYYSRERMGNRDCLLVVAGGIIKAKLADLLFFFTDSILLAVASPHKKQENGIVKIKGTNLQ